MGTAIVAVSESVFVISYTNLPLYAGIVTKCGMWAVSNRQYFIPLKFTSITGNFCGLIHENINIYA